MRREIEVLKMCQHENTVRLVDLFESETHYQIVMELMQGNDLFDYMQKRDFRLSELQVKRITHQIVQGVQYLHSLGIVHRDLKLENIMMSSDDDDACVKIADFGLATLLGPTQTASEPYGTLGYTAPEVLKKD